MMEFQEIPKLLFRIGRDENGTEWIECGECGRRSYHPMDVEYRYCGNCKVFHGVSDLQCWTAPKPVENKDK